MAVFTNEETFVPDVIEFEFAPHVIIGPEIAPGVAIEAIEMERHALVPQVPTARTFTIPEIDPVHDVSIMIVPAPLVIVMPVGSDHS